MPTPNLLTGKSVVRGISLPKALHDALIKQAQAEDRKISTIVKRALVQYLETKNDNGQEN